MWGATLPDILVAAEHSIEEAAVSEGEEFIQQYSISVKENDNKTCWAATNAWPASEMSMLLMRARERCFLWVVGQRHLLTGVSVVVEKITLGGGESVPEGESSHAGHLSVGSPHQLKYKLQFRWGKRSVGNNRAWFPLSTALQGAAGRTMLALQGLIKIPNNQIWAKSRPFNVWTSQPCNSFSYQLQSKTLLTTTIVGPVIPSQSLILEISVFVVLVHRKNK